MMNIFTWNVQRITSNFYEGVRHFESVRHLFKQTTSNLLNAELFIFHFPCLDAGGIYQKKEPTT